MPTGSGGGGVTSSSNTQINSLGVGVAADGTAGDVTLVGGGLLRTGSGSLGISAGNQNIDFNNDFLQRVNWIGINTNTGSTGNAIRLVPQTFASLPAASATFVGSVAVVSDSNTIVWGATIAGLSTNTVLAFCDGAAWTVAGK